MYGGYRFESLFTTKYDPNPNSLNDENTKSLEDEVVDNNKEYSSVYSTYLGDFKLLMAGEVDCIQ
ncbi:Decapping nuclease rai1, partial [Smittium culicis]